MKLKLAYGILITLALTVITAVIAVTIAVPSLLVYWGAFGVAGLGAWALITIDKEKYSWMEKGPGPR